jgi:LPS sulfotransferase NodH
MNIETIFNSLAETNFLEKLALENNLVFIGESNIISYLQTNLENQKNFKKNSYFVSDTNIEHNLINNFQNLIHERAIIVVSTNNENEIHTDLQILVTKLNIHLPVLRLFADVFVNLTLGRSLIDSSGAIVKQPQLSYTILTTPRSGSTFLCATLQSTQIAGLPTEHLRQPAVVLSNYCNFDYLRYLQLMMSYKVTSNNVFGTKIISHFLQNFQTSKFNIDELFEKHFSKFIYLIRKDKIAQAVSIFLAQTTNTWHISSESEINSYSDRLQQISIENHHLEKIHQHYLFLVKQEEYLEKIWETYKISPLIIEYERLVDKTESEIGKILMYLGIISDRDRVPHVTSHIKKLPSHLSERLVRAYSAIR